MNENDKIINNVLSSDDNLDPKAKLEALKKELTEQVSIVSDSGETNSYSNQLVKTPKSAFSSKFLQNNPNNNKMAGYVDACILASITAVAGIILLVSVL